MLDRARQQQRGWAERAAAWLSSLGQVSGAAPGSLPSPLPCCTQEPLCGALAGSEVGGEGQAAPRSPTHGHLLLAGTDPGAVRIRPGPRRSPGAGRGRPPRALRQPRRAPGPLLQQHGRSRLGRRGHPPRGVWAGPGTGEEEGGRAGVGACPALIKLAELRSPPLPAAWPRGPSPCCPMAPGVLRHLLLPRAPHSPGCLACLVSPGAPCCHLTSLRASWLSAHPAVSVDTWCALLPFAVNWCSVWPGVPYGPNVPVVPGVPIVPRALCCSLRPQ